MRQVTFNIVLFFIGIIIPIIISTIIMGCQNQNNKILKINDIYIADRGKNTEPFAPINNDYGQGVSIGTIESNTLKIKNEFDLYSSLNGINSSGDTTIAVDIQTPKINLKGTDADTPITIKAENSDLEIKSAKNITTSTDESMDITAKQALDINTPKINISNSKTVIDNWTKLKFEVTTGDTKSSNTQEYSLIDLIYPIGSFFISANNQDPSILYSGTTWVQIQGAFLYGSNGYKADGSACSYGTSNGEATDGSKLISAEQLPEHSHDFTGKQTTSHVSVRSVYKNYHTIGDAIYNDDDNGLSISYGDNKSTPVLDSSDYKIDYTTSSSDYNFHELTISMKPKGTVDDSTQTRNKNYLPPCVHCYIWQRTG